MCFSDDNMTKTIRITFGNISACLLDFNDRWPFSFVLKVSPVVPALFAWGTVHICSVLINLPSLGEARERCMCLRDEG